MVHNYRDLLLALTVKNSEGKNFNDISSLKFGFNMELEDEDSIKKTQEDFETPMTKVGEEFGTLVLPGKGKFIINEDVFVDPILVHLNKKKSFFLSCNIHLLEILTSNGRKSNFHFF